MPSARSFGWRAADPPLPRAVRLLGRWVPLVIERRIPYKPRRLMLKVVASAAEKLEAERKAGLLTRADAQYLRALKWFMYGRGRSGQHRGVFIVGMADAKTTQDPDYWSAAILHDGVHAWLQARARRYRDETAPCNAQIDYMQRTGASTWAISAVENFRDSRSRQRSRTAERY